MTGKAGLCAALSIMILASAAPAVAQVEAQQRCKDAVARGIFSNPDVKQDTLYWLARFSADAVGQSDSADAPFAFNGITAALAPSDVEHLLRPLLAPADWQTFYQNRMAVLLLSGQEPILKAWQQCLAEQGGGLTAYFQAGQGSTVELHIDYRRPDNAPELPPLKMARNLPIDPRLGKVVERPECLSRNYTYAPGKDCVIKIETVSKWITGTVTIPLTDGKTAADISAYLAPRATLRGEQKAWPTELMTSEWARTHPDGNPINVLSRYADERTGPRPWDISAQRDAEDGWYFVEGKRTPSPDGAFTLRSEDISVAAKPGGSATERDCAGGYKLDATAKKMFVGIGLAVSAPGPGWCYVTVTATMARLLWDPPVTAAAKPPAAPAAAPRRHNVPAGQDPVAFCEQRYRSYDPETRTFLGTDGNRYPCP
jgi:BA14K-like protein